MAGIIWKWKKKIAVVGGRITGLVAGYRLNKKIGGTVFNDFVQRFSICNVPLHPYFIKLKVVTEYG